MEKIKNKIINRNYIIRGAGIQKMLNLGFKDFYLKRNNLAIFNKDGKTTLSNRNINIYKYFSKFDADFKKWRIRNYKSMYIYSRSQKRRRLRIKMYTKRNVLNLKTDNYIKLNKFFNQSAGLVENTQKTETYEISFFEILLIKLRFLNKAIL